MLWGWGENPSSPYRVSSDTVIAMNSRPDAGLTAEANEKIATDFRFKNKQYIASMKDMKGSPKDEILGFKSERNEPLKQNRMRE